MTKTQIQKSLARWEKFAKECEKDRKKRKAIVDLHATRFDKPESQKGNKKHETPNTK